MIDRIHILGASGSGTITLGITLAGRFGYTQLDTDDYFWEPTDPPFQRPRTRHERQTRLTAALDAPPRWIVSGSLCGWGNILISTRCARKGLTSWKSGFGGEDGAR
jgi:adenylate kinase family enzyme